MMGLSNCLRCLAWFTASIKACFDVPMFENASFNRAMFKMFKATWWPFPTFPRTFSTGIVTSSKGMTAFIVERSFKGVSIGPEEKKMGIKGSSTATLILEDVTILHCFSPFKIQAVPCSFKTAVVFAFKASDPALGSVRAYAPIHSPVASFGRYFCFCSSVP